MGAIVDIHGNPIETGQLAEPQSAGPSLAYLKRYYADHPSRGLTPPRLAEILEEAERFHFMRQSELWLDIREKWGHAAAEMGKRERALLTLERRFVEPDNANRAERKATAFLNDVFDSFFAAGVPSDEEAQDAPHVDSVILGCADAIGHGFSAQEIAWRREGSEWMPGEITHRPQTWFRLDVATHSKIRLRDLSAEGARLRPGSWILHKHRSTCGYVSRQGLVRSLAWPYIFANYSIRDLAELLEIYGLPILIGKHPAQATDTEKRKLLQAVTEIGHRAGGIVPDSMAVDVLLQGAGANGDVFKQMIEWAEATASKLITGQHHMGGKTATEAIERREIKADLITTDARQIDQTLTAFGWLILTLNPAGVGVDPRRTPRHKFDTAEAEDVERLAKSLPLLIAVGADISKKWLSEKTKIPPAENDADRLSPMAPVNIPAVDVTTKQDINKPEPAPAALAGKPWAQALLGGPSKRRPPADPSPAGLYAEQLAERAAGPLAEWVAALKQAAEDAESLEELRDRFGAMFPDLSPKPMTEVFAEAMLAANLAGRLDVSRGS
jgi:phage gp29-like protein